MPISTAMPLVADLLDHFLACTEQELEQLSLDLYELGRFASHGFEKNEMPWRGQMQTSLHSCGSQLRPCPCGCRRFAFHDDRLAQKGLHGILIRLQGALTCGNNVYPKFRHVHPAELALLNGMLPDMCWGKDCKLALCALGQLASPIQAAWVGSTLMRHLQFMQGDEQLIDPHTNMLEWMEKLLESRDAVFGPQSNPNAIHFRKLVTERVFATKVTPTSGQVESARSTLPSETEAPCQVEENMPPKASEPAFPFTSLAEYETKPEGEVQANVTKRPCPCHDQDITSSEIDSKGGVPGFAVIKRIKLAPTKHHDQGCRNSTVACDASQLTNSSGSQDPACTEHSVVPAQPPMLSHASDHPAVFSENEQLHSHDRESRSCPTRPDAMPLPRLGCGGPSHGMLNQVQGQQTALSGELLPPIAAMPHTFASGNAIQPDEGQAVRLSAPPTGGVPKLKPTSVLSLSDEGRAVPPTRPGWGGTNLEENSQQAGTVSKREDDLALQPQEKNDVIQVKDPETPHVAVMQCPIMPSFSLRAETSQSGSPKCAHAPLPGGVPNFAASPIPTPPADVHAKPLPRLGCGGPAPVEPEVSQPGANQCCSSPEPQAMPLPRLGCGGPAQKCQESDGSPASAELPRHATTGLLHDMSVHSSPGHVKSEQPAGVEKPRTVDEKHQGSELTPQTMPLPRPGCGGHAVDMPNANQPKVPKELANELAAIQELLHKADHEAKVGDNPAANGGQADLSDENAVSGSHLHNSRACTTDQCSLPVNLPAKPLPRLGCGDLAENVSHESNEIKPNIEGKDQEENQYHHEGMSVHIKHEDAAMPMTCQVPLDTTPGIITQAEDRLDSMKVPMAPRSLVGTRLPLDQPLHSNQYVLLHQDLPQSCKCPFFSAKYTCDHARIDLQLPCTRLEALWRQQSWVAKDEMRFYLTAAQIDSVAHAFPPNAFYNEADAEEHSATWLAIAICHQENNQPWCSAAIIAGHWVPIILYQEGSTVKMTTTPEGSCLISAATELANGMSMTLEVQQRMLPTVFSGDCGFQALAWILALITDYPLEALTPIKASQWRDLFVQELCRDGAHEVIHHLDIGGSKLDAHEMHQLSSLLTTHGVWPERALDRANQIALHIPAQAIRQILKANRPWQDLKAAANGAKPPIKLIMPDELNAQIAQRANQRKYGKKQHAAPRKADSSKEQVTAKASEIIVPQGVFKQQDGTILGSVQVSDVGPNVKGVLLVDQDDSTSTLRLPKPVTQFGLAVIVLASKDNADLHQSEAIRFPAMCISTQEPLIASGYMYQLGSQEVVRHEPAVKLAIEEQPTEAMRCLVFKDQAGQFWDQIQQHPVKHVFQAEPLLASVENTSPVIDVWDRQWVSKKFEKVRPASAEIFVFSFRMIADKAEALMAKSGQAGIFWEPRAPCGRYPNPNYHVTWLPNLTFQDAKYAQQTSPQTTTLARHGDRFGLRSDTMNAQEIHEKHRPDTPLLLGQSKMVYAVGPLPFSTTKAALTKLLKAWQWDARPLQPKGRAQDGSGITWHIQAVEDPGHWVYTLQHGDVLISKLQDTKHVAAPMPYSIVASKKTLEHLQGADPWAHYDPWRKDGPPAPASNASTTPSSSNSSVQQVTQAQIAALEANFDKKLQMIARPTDGDASMDPTGMEGRIAQLEHQFQQVQAMQIGTDARVGQLQTQIDQQSKQLGDRIEEKLTEQMERIEQLLCKRGRFE